MTLWVSFRNRTDKNVGIGNGGKCGQRLSHRWVRDLGMLWRGWGWLRLVVLIAFLLALVPKLAYADPGWYDTSWAYRKKITIDHTKVSANLTNFPVLISLPTDSDLANDAQNDGDDILFTASDETTKLSHEIERFNGATGELVAWVKVPTLSSATDTDIYMYYGNAGAANQQDVTGTWDSNYKMVQHLEETAGTHYDSTLNNNDGAAQNGVTQNAVGKINGADDFDGTDDYVVVGSPSPTSFTDFTVSGWVNWDSDWTERGAIFSTNGYKLDVYLTSDNKTDVWIGHSVVISNSTVQYGNWQHWVATREGTAVKIYLNGALDNSAADNTSISGIAQYFIGAQDDLGSYDGKGTIDEVRISSTARSADWISTSYKNQNSPSGFYTVGSEEAGGGAPTPIGGKVYPVNKARVLAPWLVLVIAVSLAIGAGVLLVRRRIVSKGGR